MRPSPAPAGPMTFRLPSPAGVVLWTAPTMEKVLREAAPPDNPSDAIQIYAAKNEFEPFQIVVRADQAGAAKIAMTPFGGPGTIPRLEIRRVGYVRIAQPSDATSIKSGFVPDPLEPTTIGAERHRLVAALQFEDDGPGVPPELGETIFYPLVTGRAGGTGIGLAVAQDVATRHGGIIVCRSLNEAIDLTNQAASEHVVAGTESIARRIVNAGAVFVGPWTAQVAGDYAVGSNHVLPTAGAARYRGGLNAADFVKLVSVQRLTKRGLNSIGRTITTLARAEGLEGHARSVEVRQR